MSMLLEPGQLFAERYRIQRYLAEGGMGAVFVAQQLATERIVAVKVLWPNVLTSSKAVEQFQLEAKIAARVESEHIVQILDAGQDATTRHPFLVMELLKGASLESVVEERGPFSAVDAVRLLRQVALGLDKAHGYVGPDGARRPIVHRDLKPENLFLTHRESGEPHVKILDFGLAKVLSETASVSQDVKGTPLYMAYEQATGDAITPQTDIWAFGLISFFLMTGRAYWASASRQESSIAALFSEILSLPMDPASQRLAALGGGERLPAGFDEWFARAVDRDPARRFRSAGEAVNELAQLVPEARVSGAPAAPAAPFGAPAIPATLPSAGAREPTRHGLTTGQIAVASTQAPRVESSRAPLAIGMGVAVVGLGLAAFVATRGDPGEEISPAGSAMSGTDVSAPLPAPAAPPPMPTAAEPQPSVQPAASSESPLGGVPRSGLARQLRPPLAARDPVARDSAPPEKPPVATTTPLPPAPRQNTESTGSKRRVKAAEEDPFSGGR